ncbi:unnamed protein product [Discosporangium mesarthrocarpum]
MLEFFQMTRSWVVTFQKTGQMRLYAYADSSHGGDEGDRHSVSGGAVIFAGSAVAWFSRTQQVVLWGECVKVLLFLSHVLRFIQPWSQDGDGILTVLKYDMGATNLAESPSSSARSKHIDVCYHFLEKVGAGFCN